MNASTAFENRREQLADELSRAQNMQEAIACCTMALEQVACELAQEEQDEQARQRQQAVLAALRSAPQMLFAADAEGELVLGGEANAKKKANPLLAAGAFLLAALAVYEMIDGQALFAGLQLAGGALLYLGLQGGGAGQKARARGRVTVRADELVRRTAALCAAADTCVGDLALLDKEAGMARLSGTADDAMLDLLIAMMEAKASGRDDLAMRSLSQAEQYLHMLGVEIIPYSEGHAQLFDILPTMGTARTIRPALMQDGKLLRRGVAALQAGRSVGA